MNTLKLVDALKQYPTFTLEAFATIIDKDKPYAKLHLHRLKNRHIIKQIQRNVYTIQDDPLIVASRIIWPSYISLWAALRYHNLTEQIPYTIAVVTPRLKRPVAIEVGHIDIIFEKIKPAYFFGFSKIHIQGFEVFMADPEKTLIDAVLLKKISTTEIYSILQEHIKNISAKKIVDYILRTNNHALAKRFGWMLESLDCTYAKHLEKQVYRTLIPLDVSRPPVGDHDKKWGIIVNIRGI